jgi:hypothetical protein
MRVAITLVFQIEGGDTMKKNIIIGLVIALTMALASVAIARGGKGPGGMANMTPEQTQTFARFQADTLSLRQKMMQLRTELMTLRVEAKPDWKAIAGKEKEMVDVRIEIRKKAAEAGLAGFGRGGRDCDNCGMGMGMGRGGRGMGRM